MPRQDVPYGGAICRLKERIAEIWDELGKKLHSINGVEGDGAGDVKIVSGDAAIVVTSDQVNHQIEVALDSSQLPAASVSSVNGQTGAVVLDANDIDAGLTPPGTSVAQDLAGTKQQMQVIGGLVQQEILDRQNADSALQGNINAALATIPGEVSSQIANDTTIAQLVTADGQNVKLTGNQTINGVKKVDTQATGVYNEQIANSTKVRNDIFNWAVTQTGNQTKTGILTLESITGGQIVQKTTNAGFDYGGTNSFVPVSFNKVADRNGNVVFDSNVASSTNSRYQRTVLRHKVGNDVYELFYDLILNNDGIGTLRLIKLLNGAQVASNIITTI